MTERFTELYELIKEDITPEAMSILQRLDFKSIESLGLDSYSREECPIQCSKCPISCRNLLLHVYCGSTFSKSYTKIDFLKELQDHLLSFDHMVRDFVDTSEEAL